MRVLVASLDTKGFLFPAVGFALALQARGHQVALVSHPSTAAAVEEVGLRRIPRGTSDGASFETQLWALPIAVGIQVKHLEYAVREFAPDLLIGQYLTLGPLIIRERQHLPLITMGPMIYLWPTRTEMQPGGGSDTAARRSWRFSEMLKWYNGARRILSLPNLDQFAFDDNPLLGDLFLIRDPGGLGPPAVELPSRVRVVGTCLWEPPTAPDDELCEWLIAAQQSGRKIIYAHQGRTFKTFGFWSLLGQAANELGLAFIGPTDRTDYEVGPTPTFCYCGPSIPQSIVLAAARAMVASATTTPVLGALTAGVPAVLLPSGGEEPDIAEACERVGTAVCAKLEGLEYQSLKSLLLAILNSDARRERAKAISFNFTGDPFRAAVDVVDAAMHGIGIANLNQAAPVANG